VSLVLEALRRVEKSSASPGTVGVSVSSNRPAARRRGSLFPLLLGLGTGALALFFFTEPRPERRPVAPAQAPVPAPVAPALAPVVKATMPSPPAPADEEPRPGRGTSSTLPPVGEKSKSEPSRESPPSKEEELRPRDLSPARPAEADASARSPDPRAPAPGALVLQAISERDSRPIAVISDQLVREGDLIAGVRVLSIGADSVEIRLESGRQETLRFGTPPPAIEPTPGRN